MIACIPERILNWRNKDSFLFYSVLHLPSYKSEVFFIGPKSLCNFPNKNFIRSAENELINTVNTENMILAD